MTDESSTESERGGASNSNTMSRVDEIRKKIRNGETIRGYQTDAEHQPRVVSTLVQPPANSESEEGDE